jgi:hypothetical protein
MRTSVTTIALASLLASTLLAQRGPMAGGGAPVHFVGSAAVPPVHGVVPPLGSTHTRFPGSFFFPGGFFKSSRNRFRDNQGWPFQGYGGFYGGYGGFYDDYAAYGGDYVGSYRAQAQPSVVVPTPQMVMPPLLSSFPRPSRPEIREYDWPTSSSGATPEAFSIVTKDHRIESAIAVLAQDGDLHYVTPDGSKKRISISSVDRAATRQRNAENHLTLSIP